MTDRRVASMIQRLAGAPRQDTRPGPAESHPIADDSHIENRDWIRGEPAVPDLLQDPVIHAVLRRDGLTTGDLSRAIDLARARLAPAARQSTASNAA